MRNPRLSTFLLAALVLPFSACSIAIERPAAPLADLGLAAPQDRPREIDDQKIAEAFARKSQLQWPARLAVARVGATEVGQPVRRTTLVNVPSHEQEVLDAALPRGAQWSHVFPLTPVLEEGTTTTLRDLRYDAARAHADLLLVYGMRSHDRNSPNALWFFNLAVLPIFFVHGNDIVSHCVGGMALVDVRNGHVYALSGHDEKRERSVPLVGSGTASEELFKQAKGKLLERMLGDVKRQLALP